MNIRMLTPAERERLAYAEGHPDAETLGELVDTQQKLKTAGNNLFAAQEELGEAEAERDEANSKLDEIRDLVNA